MPETNHHDLGLTRRDLLKTSVAAAAAATIASGMPRLSRAAGAPADKRRPMNVLFIMTDQQRASTIRCYGNEKVRTPGLDALAAGGMRFTSCYATQPVCTPCRGSLVTGKYPTATDTWENKRPLKDHSTSWLRLLGASGYKTCYVGKWHLGDGGKGPEYIDDWHGYETGWPHWIEDRETGERQYRPDEETDYAIDWMRRHRDGPFACFVSYYPPHTPKTAPEKDVDLYKDVFDDEKQRIYHGMVHRIDWNVGRLMAALKEMRLDDNTVVIFTSDHGENHPFCWNRHLKRLCYDQSSNVPLMVRAPGLTSPASVATLPVSSADLCPTILDLLGTDVPQAVHGRSLRGLLGGKTSGWREDLLIQNRPKKSQDGYLERCVVTDRWKLILSQARPAELYDRQADPAEEKNLYPTAGAAVRTDLLDRLAAWGRRIDDPVCAELVAASTT
jgi:arylsulfatase A-like enzyme